MGLQRRGRSRRIFPNDGWLKPAPRIWPRQSCTNLEELEDVRAALPLVGKRVPEMRKK